MPPKAPVIHVPSPSPPPPSNDAQDLLVISDIMDTLDQIPPELTRVHSDLNELGAVLYSTLVSLEKKLYTLINWIQDPSIKPEKRFELLQEIAEEAARYKLGGDDKIRVAGGACDGILSHQKHISNLLAASTLLNPSPPSPYTQSLTLPYAQPVISTRRAAVQRAANSPFGGRGPAGAAGPSEGRVGDTPTKKKKHRVHQLGGKDDDEVSSVGGKEERKKPVKKRKPANRATSPTDSVASTSVFTGKPAEPRTARQLAAAASKARKAEHDDGSDDDEPRRGGLGMQITPSTDSMLDRDRDRKDGLGLDISREGSHVPGRSTNATPVLASASVMGTNTNTNTAEKGRAGRRIGASGTKRSRDEDDDDDSDMEEEESAKPTVKRTTSNKKSSSTTTTAGAAATAAGFGGQGERAAVDNEHEHDVLVGGEEVDSHLYCTCRQVSYGEMIGCDDDDCEIEWYHLACLDLDKTPDGLWICPRCVERRKKLPKGKKTSKGKGRK